MSRPRDNQRKRFYEWENKRILPLDQIETRQVWGRNGWRARLAGPDAMTLDDARAVVDLVYRRYGLGMARPEIRDGRGRRSASGGAYEIDLPHFARRPSVVLHETAHSVVARFEQRNRKQVAGHGPEFARVCRDLYCWFYELDVIEIANSMREARLDWVSGPAWGHVSKVSASKVRLANRARAA